MMVRCPICGAPMEGNVCGYCGYRYEPAGKAQAKTWEGKSSQTRSENRKNEYRKEYRQETRQEDAGREETFRYAENEKTGEVLKVSVKSRWLAFILCFFLGKFGVHRFYAGKIGTGLLWLFTGGFFGIGWIVDLVFIGIGAFEDSSGLPLYL